MENYNKLIDLCEEIIALSDEIENDELSNSIYTLAHELKATLECEYEEE